MHFINQVPDPQITFLNKPTKPNQFYTITNELGLSNHNSDLLAEARRAAECHRNSRQKVQQIIKVGTKFSEIIDVIESSTRIQLKGERNDGIGFPTGLSLNNVAAHFTLNPGDTDIALKESDVLKIDFGTHVNGRIMDSAFTVCFDSKFDNLLLASKEATEVGIKSLGVDVRVRDIGKNIAEVINSYELVLEDEIKSIKPVTNLNGHSIDQYCIHAGITIPNVKNNDTTKITADTFYAIETFATTGNAYVHEIGECSHYILDLINAKPIKNVKNKKILDWIKENIGMLPFCPRYVDYHLQVENGSKVAIKTMAMLKNFEKYPPLLDIQGSHVAQFEHTIWLTEDGKEILTRGDDY